MKKWNRIIALVSLIYLLISSGTFYLVNGVDEKIGNEYKVEINRLYSGLLNENTFSKPNLSEYKFIRDISFLPKDSSKERIEDFYKRNNSTKGEFKPWYKGESLVGFLRFDYVDKTFYSDIIFILEGGLFLLFAIIMIVLFYIRNSIIKPFNSLRNMPYELSKGHLKGELNESKSRYFGNFLWGLSLLRDNLNHHKIKELKLEKEKKLLLLSISHDIKTPLNTIKLYAKALKDGIYYEEDKKREAAIKIEEKTLEIESFVKEIIKTSSEDILEIEVNEGEFYLKDLIEKVNGTYKEKCNLMMINFKIEDFDNKLIKGDIERAFEVFENVLENAFKYGDGGGISISFYEEDYCQLIRIHNTGISMNKNEFNHIFDSFFRGSNTKGKEGNGLGLYICREIMRRMDGEIFGECESDGMSFVLVFR